MNETPSPPGGGADGPMARHAAEWGLASLLCGGVRALAALAGLVLAFLIADIGRRVMSRPEVLAATTGTAVAVALIGLVALASIAAALKSLLSARSRGQPAGLGLMGLLVSLLALGLWVFAGAELLVALLSS